MQRNPIDSVLAAFRRAGHTCKISAQSSREFHKASVALVELRTAVDVGWVKRPSPVDLELDRRSSAVAEGIKLQRHLELDLGVPHKRSLGTSIQQAIDSRAVDASSGSAMFEIAHKANLGRHKKWTDAATRMESCQHAVKATEFAGDNAKHDWDNVRELLDRPLPSSATVHLAAEVEMRMQLDNLELQFSAACNDGHRLASPAPGCSKLLLHQVHPRVANARVYEETMLISLEDSDVEKSEDAVDHFFAHGSVDSDDDGIHLVSDGISPFPLDGMVSEGSFCESALGDFNSNVESEAVFDSDDSDGDEPCCSHASSSSAGSDISCLTESCADISYEGLKSLPQVVGAYWSRQKAEWMCRVRVGITLVLTFPFSVMVSQFPELDASARNIIQNVRCSSVQAQSLGPISR